MQRSKLKFFCGLFDFFPAIPVTCNDILDKGNCLASIPRYYYNSSTKTCEEFIYTGCGGSTNNFNSKQSCIDVCGMFDHLGLSVINEKVIIKTTEQLYFQCLTMCFVVLREKKLEYQVCKSFQRIPKTSKCPATKAEVHQIMVYEVIGTVPTKIIALIL